MVRGNHKYKDVWEAEVGTTLQCQRETADPHDIYAVAVLKSGVIVGHGLKKISSTCSLFLQSGGAIHCTVTGAKRYSADVEQGGLEVPCVLKFVGDREKLKCLLDKTQKLACYALSKDQVRLKQQSVNPNEESKSVSESDSIPQTKKIKLSASCETLTVWQRDMMKSFKYMLGRRIKMYSIDRVLSLVTVKQYGILSKPASSESRPNLKIYRHNGSVGMYNQCIPWCICAFIDLTTKAPPGTSIEMPTFMPLSEAGVPLLQ